MNPNPIHVYAADAVRSVYRIWHYFNYILGLGSMFFLFFFAYQTFMNGLTVFTFCGMVGFGYYTLTKAKDSAISSAYYRLTVAMQRAFEMGASRELVFSSIEDEYFREKIKATFDRIVNDIERNQQ